MKAKEKVARVALKQVALADLKDHPRNPRKHPNPGTPEWNVLKKSLANAYWDPMVVNVRKGENHMTLVSGHLRRKVLTDLGYTAADVSTVDVDGPTHLAMMLAANQQQGQNDERALASVLMELQAVPEFDVEIAGFTVPDVHEMCVDAGLMEEEKVQDAPVDIEKADEFQKKWKVKRGDVFSCGLHRVACGDATNADDVKRLMNGTTAILFATDPPYGVAYGDLAESMRSPKVKHGSRAGKKYDKLQNDDLDGAHLQEWLSKVFLTWAPHLADNAAWYLWHAQKTQGFFTAAAAAAAVIYHRQIVWVKPQLILGRGDYHWKHELCLYGWKEGNRPPWHAGRDQHTIWEVARENDAVHPTQKPVELFARPMRNHTLDGEVCAEPFLGSGTQVIAGEQMKRAVYGMDIEEKYVAVTLERWHQLTGQTPTLCK